MSKYFLALFLCNLLIGIIANAQTASVNWYERGTYVVCGGSVDGKTLNMHVGAKDEFVGGESADGRVLVYIDLHKPTQLRWLINDGMSDEDYAKREAILSKLPVDEADHLRKLSANRQSEIYSGMTNGFVNLSTTTRAGRSINLSCQELPIPGAVVME